MKTYLFAFILAASVAMAADQQEPPAPAPAKPFTLHKTENYSLPNGMKVTLAPWGTLPIATVGMNVRFGGVNETPEQIFLADFMAELMQEGAAGKTGEEMARQAASLGGQLNFNVGDDDSYASLGVLSEFSPDAIHLLANLLRKPDFPATEIERIRANLLRRMAVEKTQPGILANEAFSKAIYGDHPYGQTFPTVEQLKAYSLQDIKKFYADNVGARRAHLYIAGRFDIAAVKKAIGEAFTDWPAGPAPLNLPPSLKAHHDFILVDRPKSDQSSLQIGLPVPANPATADYIPMEVADYLLGGAFFSRITSNIREDKGYTYSPRSDVDIHPGAAVWYESADVTTEHTADSIKEIFKEIDRMRREPPTEKELQAIKNALNGVFVLRNASAGGVISQLIFTERYGLGEKWLSSYVQNVGGVTRGDVQRIAESMLDPAKMTVVVVGDEAKIGTSLEPWKK